MTTKEKFIEMAKNITRPGIDEMMAWLETTDFYEQPHGRHESCQCERCLAVL